LNVRVQVTHAVLTPYLLGSTRIPALNGSPTNVLNRWEVYHIRLQRQLWLQPRFQPLRQSQRRYRHARILLAIGFACLIFLTQTEVTVMILQTIHSKHIAVGIDPLIRYRWMLLLCCHTPDLCVGLSSIWRYLQGGRQCE
jgi:hypothetical protein